LPFNHPYALSLDHIRLCYMIVNNSQVSVSGEPTFNNYGDQVNTRITTEVVNIHGRDTTAIVIKNTISDEFDYIKRGHVIGMKELGSVDLSEWDWHFENGELVHRWRKSARKTISTIQIHPDRQSNFTAITYEGKDAQKAWEKDFEEFSRASRTDSFKLFGINQSDNPMLIFHHELIPLAHLFTDSFWMNIYIYYLSKNKRCDREELWLNTSSGVLCKGLTGPHFFTWTLNAHKSVIRALPSTLYMLEEGSSITFFSKFGSIVDKTILKCAWLLCKVTHLDNFFSTTTQDHRHKDISHPQLMTCHPYLKRLPIDIIGGLRFDTVYLPLLEPSARWPPEAPGLWEWDDVYGLGEETRVDGGLTRFKLDDQGRVSLKALFASIPFWKGWLSQFSHVFDFLKTTGHQENFFVVCPPQQLELRSAPREYDELLAFSDAVKETRPIYLFLYPLPMSILELISWIGRHTHFWSFDEDGRSRIPAKEWERWGIPILTLDTQYYTTLCSWPTHIYTALRKWQISRGFDPSTTDWAQECGYPKFDIIGAKESRWSWTWSAFAGSDISACPC
ncbi:hypothetical protein MPER_12186, partial [Moniliophthora perniciosa FA553]